METNITPNQTPSPQLIPNQAKPAQPVQQPKVKTLSYDEKLRLFLTPCQTRDELNAWIKHFLGLEIPDKVVSRYSNSCPLDAVWEMYRICVLKQNPEDIQEILYCSSRGAGKTLSAAIAEFMIMIHDRRDVAHVGAIMAQAKRCYEYIQNYCLSPKVKELISPPNTKDEHKILQKSTMEVSIFKIGNEMVKFECVPATIKACNGIHAPFVSVDEIDTISGEGLKAIKEVSGMLDSRGDKKALRVGISTRKSTYGLMQKMIENAAKEERELRWWTILEFTERCSDDFSGVIPATYYVNQDNGVVLVPNEYERLTKDKKKEFELETKMFDKCGTCPAAVYCRGDAKNQTSLSPMLKPIKEMRKKIISEGHDWASAQLFNLKPSLEGIVFREFEEKTHVVDWAFMWKKLTNKDFPGECTHDIFIKKCHDLRMPFYAGIDWGWSNPSTLVVVTVDSRDNIYVVRSEGATYTNDPIWINYIKTKFQNLYKIQMYYPDIANGSAVDLMKQANLSVADYIDKSINLGIQTIKRFLKTPGTSEPKFFIAKETNKPLIDEFKMYHYKMGTDGQTIDGQPDDANNHWLDALRYIMTMVFGKSSVITDQIGSSNDYDLVDKSGSYKRVPTVTEYANAMGIPFSDQLQNPNNLGIIGTQKELDDLSQFEEDSGGPFLWDV